MKNRYEELDSLRGIAAMAVFFGHIMLIFPASQFTQVIEYGFRILVSGTESVILFFVLSGFVLSLPFYKSNKIGYIPYLFKRFLRIYLPFYISLIIVIFLSEIVYTGQIGRLSSVFNASWINDFSLKVVVDHLILIGSFQNGNYNPVIWSLVHEMRISILFPLLMLIVIKYNWKANVVFGVSLSIFSFILYLMWSKPTHDYFYSIHYLSIFLLGALLAKYRENLINIIRNFSNVKKISFILLGLFLYLYAKPAFVLNILWGRDDFLAAILNTWFIALGACIIILFSLSSNKMSKALLIKPIQFLGKISYSLYLYHWIVLVALTHVFYDSLPMWVIVSIAIIGSILISTTSYYLIEKPSIRLGRKLNDVRLMQVTSKKAS